MMTLLIGYGITSGLASALVLALGVARASRRVAAPRQSAPVSRLWQSPA